MRVGGPDLGAVDNVIVTLQPGAGFQAGKVRFRCRVRNSPGTSNPHLKGCAAESGPSARACRKRRSPGRQGAEPRIASEGAPASAHSFSKMNFCVGVQPVPPSSLGQWGATQPFFSYRIRVPFHADIGLDKTRRACAARHRAAARAGCHAGRRAPPRGRRYPRAKKSMSMVSRSRSSYSLGPFRPRLSSPSGWCAAAGHNRHHNSTHNIFLVRVETRPCRAGRLVPAAMPTRVR